MSFDCSPVDLDFPPKFKQFRPAQLEAFDFTLTGSLRGTLLGLPPGSGKSGLAFGLAQLMPGRKVILTADKGLQDQYRDDQFPDMIDMRGRRNFRCWEGLGTCEDGARLDCSDRLGCPYAVQLAAFNASQNPLSNYAWWIASNTKSPRKPEPANVLIADECFPAGTSVNGVPIESLLPGDITHSWSELTGKYSVNKILATRARTTNKILLLKFKSGRSITVTPNHPFFTLSGWVKAESITPLKDFVLCSTYATENEEPERVIYPGYIYAGPTSVPALRDSSGPEHKQKIPIQKDRDNAVQSVSLCGAYSSTQGVESRESRFLSPYEIQESNARLGGKSKSEDILTGDGVETPGPWGQRMWTYSSAVSFGVGSGMGYGSVGTDEISPSMVPDSVQDRHSQSDSEGSNRSGRTQSQLTRSTSTGQEERRISVWDRLESVEVYEQGRDAGFEQLCPGGVVYNIEVENDNTYIANEFIVHNCHLIFDWLCASLNFHLTDREIRDAGIQFGNSVPKTIGDWHKVHPYLFECATSHFEECRDKARTTKSDKDRASARKAESILDRISKLTSVTTDNWVLWREEGRDDGRAFRFECVWPARHKENVFQYVPRLVLMSATARPKTMSLLGIARSDYEFKEWGRQFPAVNGPVIHYKRNGSRARVSAKMTAEEKKEWLERIYSIAIWGSDRKGLIHSVSYSRAKDIAEYLISRGIPANMIKLNGSADPDSQTASQAYESFKLMPPGAILISPSFSTGWDFKGAIAEWQIISKLAMLDTREDKQPVMFRRKEDDKTYPNYVTAQDLVQACGRLNRFYDDMGMTFIVDDSWEWFQRMTTDFVPKWFRVRTETQLPKPLPKM